MIELMFPQTVSNILDYDGIKAAAKKYVEDVFVQITESFGNNLVLQSMDEEHLAEVAGHVTGNPETTLEELLDYINTDNIYHEFEFVNELTTAFPEGVEYKAFEVTGWQFPNAGFPPFSEPDRSYNYDGTPRDGTEDAVWMENAMGEEGVHNLMMSRFRGNYFDPVDGSPTWHKKSGRRASWGNDETWMTTGGFGKPSTIHINVDEARTVIEKNGLSSVENWLGTVSNKLPINLYIEINDQLRTYDSDDDVAGLSGSTEGYPMAFPYEEEEGFCTNDPDWPGPEPEPEPTMPTVSTAGFIMPGRAVTINAGTTSTGWYVGSTGQPFVYESTKSYGACKAMDAVGGNDIDPTAFALVDSSGELAVKNISSLSVTVEVIYVSVCSSPDATIITVYDSSNTPYNAFKYASDGTDYYYVLDGTQTDWTDDLSGIGYSLTPALPTVSDTMYLFNSSGGLGVGQINTLIDSNNNTVDYDTTACYACQNCMDSSGVAKNPTSLAIVNESGILKVTNISDNYISVYYVRTKKCSSNLATVITVYDSSNNPYNAFQYTSDGTDYYYVLDGTQTDWTDDLASIGYHLPAQPLELVVFLKGNGSVANFTANDYWFAVLRSDADAQSLIDFGGEIETTSDGTKLIKTPTSLFYDIIDMYSGDGTGSIPSADLSNFWCSTDGTGVSTRLYIRSINAYSNVQSWKVRITKNPNTVSWVDSAKYAQSLRHGGPLSFYDESGRIIMYDSTKTYTLIGYYDSKNPVSLAQLKTSDNPYISFTNVSGLGFLGIETTNTTATYTIQRVIYKVE